MGFSIPQSVTNKENNKSKSGGIKKKLISTIYTLSLIDIYRTKRPIIAEYIFYFKYTWNIYQNWHVPVLKFRRWVVFAVGLDVNIRERQESRLTLKDSGLSS